MFQLGNITANLMTSPKYCYYFVENYSYLPSENIQFFVPVPIDFLKILLGFIDVYLTKL